MLLPESKLFLKSGNRKMTEATDYVRMCMKCITKIHWLFRERISICSQWYTKYGLCSKETRHTDIHSGK